MRLPLVLVVDNFLFFSPGDSVDAEPHRADITQRLPGVEGEVWRQGPTLLLSAEPLPLDDQGTSGSDHPTVHLYGVPQQLPLDPGPHRRRLLCQVVTYCTPKDCESDSVTCGPARMWTDASLSASASSNAVDISSSLRPKCVNFCWYNF